MRRFLILTEVIKTYSHIALTILKTLVSYNQRAFITGKSICDVLHNITPDSCRIVTDASALQIKQIFKNAQFNPQNQQITVIEKGIPCIISPTLSNECKNDKDLRIYLSHSDFNISALAMDSDGKIIDFFGVCDELKHRQFKSLNNPVSVFKKSPGKMLSCIMHCAMYNLTPSEDIKAAIIENASLIKTSSREFIFNRLNHILLSENPDYIRLIHETKLLRYIMPQLEKCFGEPQKNKYHIYDVGEHIMQTVKKVPCNDILRWAALFHDIGKPLCSSTDSNGVIHFYGHHKESAIIAEELLYKFRMNPEKTSQIITLIEYHDVRIDNTESAIKRIMSRLDYDLFLKLLDLQLADNSAKNPVYLSDKQQKINSSKEICERIIRNNEPYKVTDLVVSSRDLINMKCKAGRKIGDTLKTLLEEVIENPTLNNRKYLLNRAKQLISK